MTVAGISLLSLLRKLVNGFFFYAGWYVCVAFAAAGLPQWGILAIAAIVVIHVVTHEHRKAELLLVAVLIPIGMMMDTIYLAAGIIAFASPNTWVPWLAPLWIGSLYALFAITLTGSLSWLSGHKTGGAIIGGVGAVVTYRAGVFIGAADFLIRDLYVMLIIGVVWAGFMPLSYRIATYLYSE